MIKDMNIKNWKFKFWLFSKINIIDDKKEKNTPPKRPSKVLFGLIVFKIFNFPIKEPTRYEKISNVIIVTINKLNKKVEKDTTNHYGRNITNTKIPKFKN